MQQMVDQFPIQESLAVPDDLRSESAQTQSSWRSVITQRSFALSAASWRKFEALTSIVARLQAGDAKGTVDHVPQVQQQYFNLDYGQKSSVLLVQRSSCPRKALAAPAQGARLPTEIASGSINVPDDMEGMEVELAGVDMCQEVLPASAVGYAISTPPAQAEPVVEPPDIQSAQRAGPVDDARA